MIELIKNYPYDNKYDYVKLFSTKTEQENYFNTFNSILVKDTEYIKENDIIFLEYEKEYLQEQGINYLIFENDTRKYYAFITQKEYARKNLTKIYIEIDVMQTFLFDITLNKSFVERKQCTISEITDFDEGLYLGEHNVVSDTTVLAKTSKYFAMFNGFKEQELIFNDNNKLVSVVDIPYSTSKPLTNIDDVQYPLYFMPLLEQTQYAKAIYEDIGISTGGSVVDGTAISKKIYRFLKGYEAFASTSYLDSGGVATIGYGITQSNSYWNSLSPSCTETQASNVLAESLFQSYAKPLYEHMQNDGVDMATVKQNHFDAFLSLAYNGGLTAVYNSDMYLKWIIDKNNPTITNSWGTYYIKDANGNIQQGLIDRRKKEIEIFDNNSYTYKPIGIVNSSGVITGTITDNNGNGYIPSTLKGDL